MSIIEIDNVSMRFNLAQEKTETLKEYTVKLLKHQLFFNALFNRYNNHQGERNGHIQEAIPVPIPVQA